MPLPVPVLDNRDFGQLVAEGRSLIPRYSRVWTDHNPSDPGITLLELLAYVIETELFQLDQVPPETVERTLALLGNPRPPDQPLDTAVADAVRALQQDERVITAEEFEDHAHEIGGDAVARAEYVVVEEPVLRERRPLRARRVTWISMTPDRRRIAVLGGVDETGVSWVASEQAVVSAVERGERYYVEEPIGDRAPLEAMQRKTDRGVTRFVRTVADADAPNNLLSLPRRPAPPAGSLPDELPEYVIPHADPLHPGEPAPVGMLLIVVDDPAQRADPVAQYPLMDRIFRELTRRRLVTARFHVIPPDYVHVQITARVARRPGTGLATQTVQERLVQFLDPVAGGEGGAGWPFGRDVYKSELYQVLEAMTEVDHVVDLGLAAPGAPERQQPVVDEPTRIAIGPMELVRTDRVDVDVEVEEA